MSPAPTVDRTAAFALVAAAVLAGSAVLVSDQHFVRGEVGLLEVVNGWPRWIGAPLEVVMQLGTLMAAAVVAIVAGLLTRRLRPGVAVFAAALAAWRLDDVLKAIVERPRPEAHADIVVRDQADGFGFPSGHTTMAFALAAVLHTMLPPPLRWVAWLLAVAAGVARMYVGVHWPMDLVGGAALGLALGFACSALVRNRYGRRAT